MAEGLEICVEFIGGKYVISVSKGVTLTAYLRSPRKNALRMGESRLACLVNSDLFRPWRRLSALVGVGVINAAVSSVLTRLQPVNSTESLLLLRVPSQLLKFFPHEF